MAGIYLPALAGWLNKLSACALKARLAPFLSRKGGVASFLYRPEIGRDYPLNLSISLSGGKETNQDSLSNGE